MLTPLYPGTLVYLWVMLPRAPGGEARVQDGASGNYTHAGFEMLVTHKQSVI